jgi:hypothetical protein
MFADLSIVVELVVISILFNREFPLDIYGVVLDGVTPLSHVHNQTGCCRAWLSFKFPGVRELRPESQCHWIIKAPSKITNIHIRTVSNDSMLWNSICHGAISYANPDFCSPPVITVIYR